MVLLLSKQSVNKRGFVQREANDAIERLRYKQPTDIYVIPLLLEPCEVPGHIAGRLQYVDLSTPGAWDQVRASLKFAAEQQSIELAQGLNVGPFHVFTDKIEAATTGAGSERSLMRGRLSGSTMALERILTTSPPSLLAQTTSHFSLRLTK